MKEGKSVLEKMKQIIEQSHVCSLFNNNDFKDCGPYSAIRTAVVELCKEGLLERVAQGVYVKPNKDKDRKYIPDNITLAIEIDRKNGSVATPRGKTLDYINGNLNKMPNELQFFTTGAGRLLTLPDGTIVKFFKKK